MSNDGFEAGISAVRVIYVLRPRQRQGTTRWWGGFLINLCSSCGGLVGFNSENMALLPRFFPNGDRIRRHGERNTLLHRHLAGFTVLKRFRHHCAIKYIFRLLLVPSTCWLDHMIGSHTCACLQRKTCNRRQRSLPRAPGKLGL